MYNLFLQILFYRFIARKKVQVRYYNVSFQRLISNSTNCSLLNLVLGGILRLTAIVGIVIVLEGITVSYESRKVTKVLLLSCTGFCQVRVWALSYDKI